MPTPHTTSDALSAYVGRAVINLSATDNVRGSFGVKKTYYRLDSGPAVAGTALTVMAPASGTKVHTLTFWSTDWSGNIESAHVATFDVAHDVTPPVTSCNPQASYGTTATVYLLPTDDSRDYGIRDTYYSLDGATPATGTVVTVPRSSSGTVSHSLQFWSIDQTGNREATKTVSFDVVRDTVAPTTTVNLPRWGRSSSVWISLELSRSESGIRGGDGQRGEPRFRQHRLAAVRTAHLRRLGQLQRPRSSLGAVLRRLTARAILRRPR